MSMIRIEILSCHINKDANFKTYNVKHKFNKNFNKNCETNSFVIILSHKYNVLHAVKKLMGHTLHQTLSVSCHSNHGVTFHNQYNKGSENTHAHVFYYAAHAKNLNFVSFLEFLLTGITIKFSFAVKNIFEY